MYNCEICKDKRKVLLLNFYVDCECVTKDIQQHDTNLAMKAVGYIPNKETNKGKGKKLCPGCKSYIAARASKCKDCDTWICSNGYSHPNTMSSLDDLSKKELQNELAKIKVWKLKFPGSFDVKKK